VRTLLALVVTALLCGCSTVRFAYENADTYLRWKAGSYVELEGEAAEELDDRIEEFHAWHRREQLPKYVKLAHEASQRFSGGLSRRDVVWGYDALRAQARESLRKGGELAAPLLDRLEPEQVAQIERRFVEENRQFYRDHLRGSERERRERRAQRVVNRLEDWVGKLTQAQVERVRQYSERAPLADELRDRDRKRLQKDVVAIVRARAAQKRLAERLEHWERGREPAYEAALDKWREESYALLLDLERTLSPEQRTRVLAQLRRYADDFEALAAR
jgi:hypothetical protein